MKEIQSLFSFIFGDSTRPKKKITAFALLGFFIVIACLIYYSLFLLLLSMIFFSVIPILSSFPNHWTFSHYNYNLIDAFIYY